MVKWSKITSLFFLSLFMWQLVVLFASHLINPQLFESNQSTIKYNQLEQSFELSADCEILDSPSNQLVEEVLEEEIELSETAFVFDQMEIVDFQTYYLVNDYHSVLTSDYIPPETTV
ncbi:MAG: hypothetical protein NWQ47_08755 [Crocinitomicaceae bacterium]|nr:hypothetical protein [Crocinitomicaceae bacterium]